MASGRLEAECQGPAAGALLHSAANLSDLPSAGVRTAVHVQHLPGDGTSFRQINNSVSDLLRVGDCSHRRKGFQEVLGILLVHWSVDDSRGDRIEADVFLRVFIGKTEGNGIEATLG